jgi:hypothetical protein
MKKWSHNLFYGAILCVLVLFTVSPAVRADNFAWTLRTTPVGAIWQAVAASSDCQKIAIGGEDTYIYTSTNGGISWTQRTGSGDRNWYGLASTADGTMLAAATYDGYIYTSTDGGANWTKQTGSDSLYWKSIASSSDGSKLVATSSYIYASTDSGATWTPLTSAGSRSWWGIAISPDGTKLAAAVAGGYVYTSSDGGTTWTERSGVDSQSWMPLAASSDNKTIIVGAWGSYVKSSSDSGNTWTQHDGVGSAFWWGAACSADGNVMGMAQNYPNGYVWTTTDGGSSWSSETSAGSRTWWDVVSSSDGTKLVASYSGYVYVGTTSPSAPTVTTTTITSITSTTASGGGNVTDDGWNTVTARGVCWSTSENPTVADSHTVDGAGTGEFTSSLTGLSPNTAYYVRAYAINSVDTGYGDQESFTTLKAFIISGHVWTSDSTGIDSVVMNGLPGNIQTDTGGYYNVSVDSGWSGVVTPARAGYTFDPESTSYSDVTDSQQTNYIGTLLTYTISGHVRTSDSTGIDSVTMSGLPGNPQTDTGGYYTATVDCDWSGVVTPTKDGYTFDPESTSYSSVTDSQETNYIGTLLTYTISGYVQVSSKAPVGIDSVIMNGLPGNVSTDSTGYYIATVDYGWSGTVKPAKTGYTFSPESTVYDNVTSNQDSNYTGTLLTYSISGYVHLSTKSPVGIDSVIMNGLPGNVSTDSTGYYTATVDYGWSGTVKPGKTGYSFSPESTVYDNVTSNQDSNYTGTLLTYSISGYVHLSAKGAVGIDSVTMSGLPGNPLTDSTGYYIATVDYGWSGTVKPGKTGYFFSPDSTVYDNVTSNQDSNYTGTLLTYSISGYVHLSAKSPVGIDSVIMNGLPGNVSTDSTGYYTATVDYGWSGTVKPGKTGYFFSPDSTVYTNVTSNQDTNYTGTLFTFTISGYVINSDSVGVSGVVMSGLPGDPQTDEDGFYSGTVDYGWSGTVTPIDTCPLLPESTYYESVTSNQTDQNYVEDCLSQGVEPDKDKTVPKDYQLTQNSPNPFNPSTEIDFALPKSAFVTLKVYNILGQEVITLVDKNLPAGTYRVRWDGTNGSGRSVSSGVYFYRIQTGNYLHTKRMLLLK